MWKNDILLVLGILQCFNDTCAFVRWGDLEARIELGQGSMRAHGYCTRALCFDSLATGRSICCLSPTIFNPTQLSQCF